MVKKPEGRKRDQSCLSVSLFVSCFVLFLLLLLFCFCFRQKSIPFVTWKFVVCGIFYIIWLSSPVLSKHFNPTKIFSSKPIDTKEAWPGPCHPIKLSGSPNPLKSLAPGYGKRQSYTHGPSPVNGVPRKASVTWEIFLNTYHMFGIRLRTKYSKVKVPPWSR